MEIRHKFSIARLGRGDYRIVSRRLLPNEGVLGWLLTCPEMDFFVPLESESTDTL